MRKMICIILSLIMLTAIVPMSTAGAASNMPYGVYNLSFNDKTASTLEFNLETSYVDDGNGGKALVVMPDGKNTVFAVALTDLQKNCQSEVSVQIKLGEGQNDSTAKLIARFTLNNTQHDYVLDEATVNTLSWVSLSSKLDSTYMSYSGDVQLLLSVEEAGNQQRFYVDNLVVNSNKAAKVDGGSAVPDIKSEYDGNLLMRASFEKPTLEMFSVTDDCFLITDEVGAHTGQYALKCMDRTADWENLQVTIREGNLDTKYYVSAWVKKSPDVASCTFHIQEMVTTVEDGSKWKFHSSTTVSDEEWHYLEAVIDGEAYAPVKQMGFRITLGDGRWDDYYVDDFIVRADTSGELYDDMDYVEGQVSEGISTTPSSISPIEKPLQDDIPILKDVFKDYFKIGGCCAIFSNKDIASTMHGKLLAKHFNSMVHDGAMKSANMLDAEQLPNRVYTFKEGDLVMDFAVKNGIDDIVGHTLNWDSRDTFNPALLDENGELVDADTAHIIMKEYIQKVITHFEGDGAPSEYLDGIDYSDWHIDAWDVCNEVVYAGDEVYGQTFGYMAIIGPSYIEAAYRYADELGYEDIQLRYNDYGEQDTGKRQAIYDLCKRLLDANVGLDVLGLQTHYRINVIPSQARKAFEQLSSLGIQIDVTELDVSAYTDSQVQHKTLMYEDGVTVEAEMAQANLYYNLFQIYREYADVIGRVCFWTFEDAHSYQNRSDTFTRTDYAGIFDRHYQAKPQFWAIADPDYYFENILKEDTSKVRIVIDGVTLKYDEGDVKEEDGVTFLKCSKLLEELGIEYVYLDGKYSFIGMGHFVTVEEGAKQTFEFKQCDFNSSVIADNGELYVPVIELCTLMGYSAEYNDRRNMVSVSSNQVSNSL